MLAMNEALMLGSLRQHELAKASQLLNVQLQREISERKRTGALLAFQQRAFEMVAVAGAALEKCLSFGARNREPIPATSICRHSSPAIKSGTHFEQTVAPSLPTEYAQAVNGMAVQLPPPVSCCAAGGG